jgi:hypothetical protein
VLGLITAFGAENASSGGAFFGLFLLGVIAAPWVVNFMIMRRPRGR